MSTTDVSPANIADLTTEQLRSLVEEHGDDPETRAALEALIETKTELEAKEAEATARRTRKGKPRGLKNDEPTGRAITASETFMADPERVAVWDEAVRRATQPDGKVILSPKMIQLGVGAYYHRRSRDKREQQQADQGASTE